MNSYYTMKTFVRRSAFCVVEPYFRKTIMIVLNLSQRLPVNVNKPCVQQDGAIAHSVVSLNSAGCVQRLQDFRPQFMLIYFGHQVCCVLVTFLSGAIWKSKAFRTRTIHILVLKTPKEFVTKFQQCRQYFRVVWWKICRTLSKMEEAICLEWFLRSKFM
jgi:hypothetical protein